MDKTGLTANGREMVRRMEVHRMLVDPALAAPRTIDDVLAIHPNRVRVRVVAANGHIEVDDPDDAAGLAQADLTPV